MQIAQFDKLRQLVQECTDLIYRLKFENSNLQQENKSIKDKLESTNLKSSDHLAEKYKALERENLGLRDKQKAITSRLIVLLDRVKTLAGGVES